VERVCGVGDSLDHDILGAKNTGIASIWTANGIHSAEMGTIEGSTTLAGEKVTVIYSHTSLPLSSLIILIKMIKKSMIYALPLAKKGKR
jgi:ribonucleotide monophosphatase NagD (HAD superfamily)